MFESSLASQESKRSNFMLNFAYNLMNLVWDHFEFLFSYLNNRWAGLRPTEYLFLLIAISVIGLFTTKGKKISQ